MRPRAVRTGRLPVLQGLVPTTCQGSGHVAVPVPPRCQQCPSALPSTRGPVRQAGMLGATLPPRAGVWESQHEAGEMRTCRGIMPIRCPLTPHKSSALRPYLPPPRPPRSPSSSSQANGLFGHGDSCTVTLGCAWEPLNGSTAASVERSGGRQPQHSSATLPAPTGNGSAPRSRAGCQTLACSCRLSVRLRTLTFMV